MNEPTQEEFQRFFEWYILKKRYRDIPIYLYKENGSYNPDTTIGIGLIAIYLLKGSNPPIWCIRYQVSNYTSIEGLKEDNMYLENILCTVHSNIIQAITLVNIEDGEETQE